MYELIKETAGIEQAQKINVLDIPFENYMNGLTINFVGAFANGGEVLGLDIIQKLAEISTKYNKNNFNAMIKGYSDENILAINEHFSQDFLKKNLTLADDKYYIVGPPTINTQVPKALRKLGISEEKIMLV